MMANSGNTVDAPDENTERSMTAAEREAAEVACMVRTKEVIEAQKWASFRQPSEIRDEDALGVAVAHYAAWEGGMIVATFQAALEDANYSQLASKVGELWEDEMRAFAIDSAEAGR